MSNPGQNVNIADLLNSVGAGQSVGSQAQFGIYLQLIQRIVAALEGSGPTPDNTNPFTVYPFTGTGDVTIASAFPTALAGTIAIRKITPAATAVNLPSGGGPWLVADGAGVAGTYPITINPPSGFTINGAASFVLAFNWQEAGFILDIGASNYIVGL